MAWKKGETGNPNGHQRRRLISTQIERELLQAVSDGDVTKARKIAQNVVEKAVAGDSWAIQFVTDRTEGKADQHVSITRNIRQLSDGELEAIAAGSGEGVSESSDVSQEPSQVH